MTRLKRHRAESRCRSYIMTSALLPMLIAFIGPFVVALTLPEPTRYAALFAMLIQVALINFGVMLSVLVAFEVYCFQSFKRWLRRI